jgi:nucleoid DNA-binding protein
MRNNNKFFQKFAAAIVKRSGIARPTVEAVLPHVFDEIRYILTEGQWPCVPIESFGTFATIEKPEREYKKRGVDEWKTLPPKKQIKFSPTRNMRREIESGHYDDTRHAFSRHPDDPPIKKRFQMRYQKKGPVPVERKTPNCLPANSTEDEEKH